MHRYATAKRLGNQIPALKGRAKLICVATRRALSMRFTTLEARSSESIQSGVAALQMKRPGSRRQIAFRLITFMTHGNVVMDFVLLDLSVQCGLLQVKQTRCFSLISGSRSQGSLDERYLEAAHRVVEIGVLKGLRLAFSFEHFRRGGQGLEQLTYQLGSPVQSHVLAKVFTPGHIAE